MEVERLKEKLKESNARIALSDTMVDAKEHRREVRKTAGEVLQIVEAVCKEQNLLPASELEKLVDSVKAREDFVALQISKTE